MEKEGEDTRALLDVGRTLRKGMTIKPQTAQALDFVGCDGAGE